MMMNLFFKLIFEHSSRLPVLARYLDGNDKSGFSEVQGLHSSP